MYLDKLEVEVQSPLPGQTDFYVKNADILFLNKLRRIILRDIPTMAVDSSDIKVNTSSLYNELLYHRLTMIPIKADPRKYSEDDIITFKLKCKGHIGITSIYSRDLEWVPKDGQEPVKPVHDNILIVKLAPGQEIDMELYCKKGTGSMHTKWSPAHAFHNKNVLAIKSYGIYTPEELFEEAVKLT